MPPSPTAASDFPSAFGEALRAPLAFAMGHVGALDDGTLGPLAPAQRRAVRHVLDGLVRAQLLAADLRAAADLAAGRIAVRPSPIDYDDVIRQTLEAFEPLAEARAVTLERRAAGAGEATLDVALVPQVLTALVYNAIALAPRGGTVPVRVHARRGRLVTEIGTGLADLSPAVLGALFSHDGQLDAGAPGEPGRAILGLRVAGALVEAHGGELGAMDGAFFFTLPHAPTGPGGEAP